MTTPDPATVELVASSLAQADGSGDPAIMFAEHRAAYERRGRAVVRALADAGYTLVGPGGETVTEYGFTTVRGPYRCCSEGTRSRDHGKHAYRRTVINGPWEPING